MARAPSTATPPLPSSSESPAPLLRSAAVARRAHMPVATLRIWEQRHQAVRPLTSPAGHRLYSLDDVQRVLMLRRLTEQGHAIGTLAGLDSAQLQQLLAPAAARAPDSATRPPLRLLVVGAALAARLQRPPLARPLAGRVQLMAVFDALADAAHSTLAEAVDLLVWHAPTLRVPLPESLQAARVAGRAGEVAVVYRYARPAAIQAAREAGLRLLREPADDDGLAAWLGALAAVPAAADDRAAAVPSAPSATAAPPRFDEATLTAIAGLPARLECECPRHVAELLMQLASFETYSADCLHRDAADAALHGYLRQVAGQARMLFESALERLVRHEGLPLP